MVGDGGCCSCMLLLHPVPTSADAGPDLCTLCPDLCTLHPDDIVEAHCYFVDIGRIDREQIRSRINNNDCRTFRPRRPLSTAYRTKETAV